MQPGVGQPGQRGILRESGDRPWENRKTLQKNSSSCRMARLLKCTQKNVVIQFLFAPPGSHPYVSQITAIKPKWPNASQAGQEHLPGAEPEGRGINNLQSAARCS